jgi:hypothetical protein
VSPPNEFEPASTEIGAEHQAKGMVRDPDEKQTGKISMRMHPLADALPNPI